MPQESGPFTINATEWRTNAEGNVTRTTPAKAAVVDNLGRRVLNRLQTQKVSELQEIDTDLADLNGRRPGVVQEIADLQTLIDNSRAPG